MRRAYEVGAVAAERVARAVVAEDHGDQTEGALLVLLVRVQRGEMPHRRRQQRGHEPTGHTSGQRSLLRLTAEARVGGGLSGSRDLPASTRVSLSGRVPVAKCSQSARSTSCDTSRARPRATEGGSMPARAASSKKKRGLSFISNL